MIVGKLSWLSLEELSDQFFDGVMHIGEVCPVG